MKIEISSVSAFYDDAYITDKYNSLEEALNDLYLSVPLDEDGDYEYGFIVHKTFPGANADWSIIKRDACIS